MIPEREIMAVCEVASYLGVSRSYVQRLVKHGKLDGYKVGKIWMIRKASLLNYNPNRRGRPCKGTK